MLHGNWQNAAAAAAVALAGLWMAYRGWLALTGRRRRGCGACQGCGDSPSGPIRVKTLVSIDPPPTLPDSRSSDSPRPPG